MIYNTRSSNQKKHGMWPSESVSAITPFFVSQLPRWTLKRLTNVKKHLEELRCGTQRKRLGDSFGPKHPPKPRRDLDNLDGKKGHRVAGFHGDQPLDLSNEPPSRNHRIVRKNPQSSVFGILGRKTPGHICKNILVVFTVGVSVDSTPYFCLSNLPMAYDGLVPRCPKMSQGSMWITLQLIQVAGCFRNIVLAAQHMCTV